MNHSMFLSSDHLDVLEALFQNRKDMLEMIIASGIIEALDEACSDELDQETTVWHFFF